MIRCNKCGTNNKDKSIKCSTCGVDLPIIVINDRICPRCGIEYPASAKLCEIDDTRLESKDNIIWRCVVCDKKYTENIRYCLEDGGQIVIDSIKNVAKSPVMIEEVEEEEIEQDPVQISFSPIQSPTVSQQNYNLPIHYYKAPLGKRFVASLLDGLISILFAIPGFIVLLRGRGENGIGIILTYVPILFYSCIKDGLKNGQSFGKKSQGLMVVRLETNEPCNKSTSFGRTIVGSLLGIIPYVGMFIEPIMVFANSEGRRIADLAAGTQVIEKSEYTGQLIA